MMKHLQILSIVLLSIIACQRSTPEVNTESQIRHVDALQTLRAGDQLTIKVEIDGQIPTMLVRSTSGTHLISSSPTLSTDKVVTYEIPESITRKSGLLHWVVISGQQSTKGQITITPDTLTEDIEVYIGPTTLTAGMPESSMTTALLTDRYDNLLADNHPALLTTSIQGVIQQTDLSVNHGVVSSLHDAPSRAGIIYTTLSSDLSHSEEYSYQVNAAVATHCVLTAHRQHSYADGSTPLTLMTQRLVDKYANPVENGTLVTFTAVDTRSNISQAQTYTIDGIAKSTLVHPAYATGLSIHANIHNLKSNTIELQFEEVMRSLPLHLDSLGVLTVGPLQSYMEQMIPDGLPIEINLYAHDHNIYTTTLYSQKGKVTLDLNNVIITPLDTSLIISVEAAGLKQTISNKHSN